MFFHLKESLFTPSDCKPFEDNDYIYVMLQKALQ